MNGKPGVLAVMDELIDFEERHAEYEPRANYEARAARATVERLAEAMEEILIDMESVAPKYRSTESIERARAALAAFRGEQA